MKNLFNLCNPLYVSSNPCTEIPSEKGWEVQVVADAPPAYHHSPIVPNIEHAYVYYMEHRLHTDTSV